jgi:hypothetical protein
MIGLDSTSSLGERESPSGEGVRSGPILAASSAGAPIPWGMRLASLLLRLSSVVFAVTELAYLLVPGLALSVVGIPSAQTSDFLPRTEGVALSASAPGT